jgi:tetratricopeptide (TPR) repeat protein
MKQTRTKGDYHSLYHPHNTHFLVWAYMIQGRKQDALEGATKIAHVITPDELKIKTFLNSFVVIPFFVMIRFGMWNDILEIQEPPKGQDYPRAIRAYARGVAFARQNSIKEAEIELKNLKEISNDPVVKSLILLSYNKSGPILDIAIKELSGEIELAKKNIKEAIAYFQKGIILEDELGYNEPPDWMIPMRETLGFTYLSSNQPEKAEIIFLENLQLHPNDGWSLKGLYQSLLDQGKNKEAENLKKKLDAAWSKAD